MAELTLAIWQAREGSHGELVNGKERKKIARELIAALGTTGPITTEQLCYRLCDVLSDRENRPVKLAFIDVRPMGLSGCTWISKDDTGPIGIVVSPGPSWIYRLGVLLHEIAHRLLRHAAIVHPDGSPPLFGNLDSQAERLIAGRTDFTTKEEHDAEQLATTLSKALFAWSVMHGREPLPVSAPTALHRIAESME